MQQLVGRSAELATVRGLVDAAAGGRGGALLVAGEAGIGKTRLLDEAARRATAAGMVVLSGRAVQGGGTYRAVAEAVIGTLDRPELADSADLRPYRPAIGRLLPGWAGADGGAVPPATVDPVVLLGEGLLRLLRAGGPACLLRLEDLHWADDDTLALVEHLASAATGTSVLLAVSARDEGRAMERLAGAPGVSVVRPGRLDRTEVAALAAACRGGRPVSDADLDRLLARSEGVPFLVEERVDGPGDGVPPTLAGLVGARLATLAPDERAVLAAAAVLGGELDWRLLAPTAGVAEPVVVAALRAAVSAALLTADLRWPHALTREAVLSSLLAPERAVLARRGAGVLARRAGPDDRPRAAELYLDAGEPGTATELLLELAREDVRRGALRSAERLLTRAAASGTHTAEVTVERVRVLALVGRGEEALALGDAALHALHGDAHAELCLALARAAVVEARWAVAESYVERAGRPDDPRSLVLHADAAFGAGRAEEAAALATAAVARAEEVGAPAALCEALGVAMRAGRRADTAPDLLRRAAQVAAEHGLTPWRVEALTQLGIIEALESDHPLSLHHARQQALDAGMLLHVGSIDVVLADHAFLVQGPRAAEPHARRACETVAPLGLPVLHGLAENSLACSVGALGDPAEMEALLASALRRSHGDPDVAAWGSMVRAVVALTVHDLAAATAHADAGAAHLLDHEAAPPLHPFGLWALLHTVAGDPSARDRIRRHPAGQRAANRAALGYAEAFDAGRAGRADEAAARFAAADAEMGPHHWWRRLVRLVALEGAVVDGWGDPVPTLRADLEHHERAGDDGLARTCRDLLRRAGQPARRGRGTSAVPPELRALGVTSREVDVLDLVTQGLTNAQVAQRLFLSTRTVDSHVASLLAKTGASGRAELRSTAGVRR